MHTLKGRLVLGLNTVLALPCKYRLVQNIKSIFLVLVVIDVDFSLTCPTFRKKTLVLNILCTWSFLRKSTRIKPHRHKYISNRSSKFHCTLYSCKFYA